MANIVDDDVEGDRKIGKYKGSVSNSMQKSWRICLDHDL